jgi:hypothetical protein
LREFSKSFGCCGIAEQENVKTSAGRQFPLLLLHDALSEGIHEYTDAECLELATAIRLILTDLSEKISMTLKEKAEIKPSC